MKGMKNMKKVKILSLPYFFQYSLFIFFMVLVAMFFQLPFLFVL